MKQNATAIEENSIEKMNALIKSIRDQDKSLTDETLAVALGYNDKYFSQARSRGDAPQKLLNKLEDYRRLQNVTPASETAETPTIRSLSRSIELNAESRLIEAKNIERLVALLERSISSGIPLLGSPSPSGEVGEELPAAAKELRISGRTGPYQTVNRKQQGN